MWLVQSWIGVLLLGFYASQEIPGSCPRAVAPRSPTGPLYEATPGYGFGFLSPFVRSFLNTVQPNPFPGDLVVDLIRNISTLNNQSNAKLVVERILRYETGFLVAIAVGVLYIVFVPLAGFCMACCRCCGNCGGRMYQRQTEGIPCRRRGLYWATVLVTLIILVGNIFMFKSNQSLSVSVEKTPTELKKIFGNLETYINSVPKQINGVVNASYSTVDQVSQNLNEIGPLLGGLIQRDLQGPLYPALNSVRTLVQVVSSASTLLVALNDTLARLQPALNQLAANLTRVRDGVNNTLSRLDCVHCAALQADLDLVSMDSNLNIPSLNELQTGVNNVVKSDLNSTVNAGEEFLQSIPQRVENDTKETVQSVQHQLGNIKTQISRAINDLPLNGLSNISKSVAKAQTYIQERSSQVPSVDILGWIVGIILSCLILLVVLCNILGLLLGPAGLEHKVDPTERSNTASCGGYFFMAGAGLSFLFSWLLMLFVLVLFLFGGNLYTLVCKPWHDGQLLQIIDTPGVIPGFQLSQVLGLKTNLTFTQIYNECEKNMPLWTTLHLEEIVNLNDVLNITQYTTEIQKNFENNKISLSTITLVSPSMLSQLRNFTRTTSNLDFNSPIQLINTLTKINFNPIADQLDSLAGSQPNLTVKDELQSEAKDLRAIQSNIKETIKPQLVELSATIQQLAVLAAQINATVENVLSRVAFAQDFLNNNVSQSVILEIQTFLDCQIGYFAAFIDWANLTITQQIGRCGPVAGVVDGTETVVCFSVVESLNAFWFSLGWCTVFLVPSIIFSIKLAKYYRRMEHGDIYEKDMAMNMFPRANFKPEYTEETGSW